MGCHTPRRFPYTTPPELRGAGGRLHQVVIVGQALWAWLPQSIWRSTESIASYWMTTMWFRLAAARSAGRSARSKSLTASESVSACWPRALPGRSGVLPPRPGALQLQLAARARP